MRGGTALTEQRTCAGTHGGSAHVQDAGQRADAMLNAMALRRVAQATRDHASGGDARNEHPSDRSVLDRSH